MLDIPTLYLYTVTGAVIRGYQRGRQLGYPTANIAYEGRIPFGVYAAIVQIGKQTRIAATFVGKAETFDSRRIFIESYILDFSENLYGREITVYLVHKIRNSRKFKSAAALTSQIQKDIAKVRHFTAVVTKRPTINVAAALIRQGEKILLARRTSGHYRAYWEFPGGKIEKSEIATAAITREIKEELDLEIKPVGPVNTFVHKYYFGSVYLILVECNTTDSKRLARLQKEGRIRWITGNPTNQKIVPMDREIISYLILTT